jgi:hypothetical protein
LKKIIPARLNSGQHFALNVAEWYKPPEPAAFRPIPAEIRVRRRVHTRKIGHLPRFCFPLAVLGQSVQVIIPSGANCSQAEKRPSGDNAA